MGYIHPKQLIWKVYIFVFLSEYVDVVLEVHVKICMCKYCEIGTDDDDMYVYRYIGVLRIYTYIIQQTCCIVHVFGFAKSSMLHHMSSFSCISYC